MLSSSDKASLQNAPDMVQLIGGMSTYLKAKLLQMSVKPVMNTILSCSRLGWSIYVSYSLIINASTYGPDHEVVADSPLPQSLPHLCYSICTPTTTPKPFQPWMNDKRLKIVLVAFAYICCGCIKFLAHLCRSRSCANGYPSAETNSDT